MIFSIYVNDIVHFGGDSFIYLDAHGTVNCAIGPSSAAVLPSLQIDFTRVQQAPSSLNFLFNTAEMAKTNVIW